MTFVRNSLLNLDIVDQRFGELKYGDDVDSEDDIWNA
jgi:hypothetical protein